MLRNPELDLYYSLHAGGLDHGRSKKYLCSLEPSFYLIFALGGKG